MKALRTPLILASLLAALTGSALAHMNGDGPSGHGAHGTRMEKMREHRSQHHQKHLAELQARLQLQPPQEAAWTTFSQAMQPPATPAAHMEHSTLEKLPTPERIDQMQALHAQRQTQMKQRGDAIKAFYAQLSPEQQKTFDAHTARWMAAMGGMGAHGQHARHH